MYEKSQTENTNYVSVNTLIQPKKHNTTSVLDSLTASIQKRENKTGLPDHLKTGIENLSGMSMDDVQVHYNSSKPAQLQALAYTQGSDIHVGPGQEPHLPHEVWHVVQQKQGRVQPTFQMKRLGVEVNDDPELEREADEMGRNLIENRKEVKKDTASQKENIGDIVQRTKIGKKVGTAVGGSIIATGLGAAGYLFGGPIGAVLGSAMGLLIGGKLGNLAGNKLTGRNSYESIPQVTFEAKDLDFTLPKGTRLYHGTRWHEGEKEWWKTSFPGHEGEDGGISFTLDPKSTPKVKNAQIIIEYKLKQNTNVIYCKGKGDFKKILTGNPDSVCYTNAEREISIAPNKVATYLEYLDEYNGAKSDLTRLHSIV
jgi:hypothetical protein